MDIDMAKEVLGDTFRFSVVDTHPVIQALNLPRQSRILDAGTGVGSLAITLALEGYRVLTGEPGDDASIYAKQDWLGNARKVGLDHLIEYQAFDAKAIPFEANRFDAIFSLGTLHHIDEADRESVLKEFVRVARSNAVICFFEPNLSAIETIRTTDATHPDAADPNRYTGDLNLSSRKIEGTHFDAFVLNK